ncbi:MAG TPA: hypothetical protein VIN56_06270 [Candidatus Dormibacteraeota bacterium]|jgi:hypothetical protein
MHKRATIGAFVAVAFLSGCGQGTQQVSLDKLLSSIIFGAPKPVARSPRPGAPAPLPPLPQLVLPDNSVANVFDQITLTHPYRSARRDEVCPPAKATASAADPVTRFLTDAPKEGSYLFKYQKTSGTTVTSGFQNYFIRVTKKPATRPATTKEQQTSSGGTGTPNATYLEFEYDVLRPYPLDDPAPTGYEIAHYKVKQGNLYYDAYDPESGLVLASTRYVDGAGKDLPGVKPFSPPAGQGLLLFPLPRITGLEPSVATYLAGAGAGVPSAGNPREWRSKSADPGGESYAIDANVGADPEVVDACGTLVFAWPMDLTVVHTPAAGAAPTTSALHWDNTEQKLQGLFTHMQPNKDATGALPPDYQVDNIGQLDPGPLPTNLPK